MNWENEHIDDLLGKVLSGEANAEEIHAVDSWKNENDENLRYYNHLLTIFSRAGTVSTEHSFDTDIAWDKVKLKLRTEPKVIPLKARKTSSWSWRIAATLIVLIGIGSIGYFMFSKNEPQFAVVATDKVVHEKLPDGSMAALNTQSMLTYEFDENEKTRRAVLKGEAFFEVVHDDSKAFIIETQDVFIRDIGTAFNVRSNENNDSIVVFVKEGEVAFYSETDTGLSLVAGEEGIYIKSTKKFIRIQPEDENAPSYADREFRFNNTPLKKVLRKLNEVYDIKLELANAQLEDCRISVNFMNDDIETIAGVIAETMGWNIEKGDGKLLLDGEKCEP